jgi:hypothetical protein
MRRWFPGLFLTLAGCSTAPIADFMDTVAPGGPPRDPPARTEAHPRPRERDPADPFPPPAPRRDDPPPLPPVPTGYAPPPPIEGDEGEPSARLRTRPVRPGE